MTANQLKYWELRWKQHYERLYLEETKRSNLAKENETARHNRAQERIATQQNVLRKIELSLKGEELSIKWQELAEKQKANIMSWLFKTQELDQTERKLKAEIDNLLATRAIAIAQFKVDAQHKLNQDFANFVKSNATALKNGWGKGAAAIGLSALESIPGIANYNSILNELETNLGIVSNTKLSVNKDFKDTEDEHSEQFKSYQDEYGNLKKQEEARALEMYGPDVKKRTGVVDKYRNRIKGPSEATFVQKSDQKVTNGVAISQGTPESQSTAPQQGTSGVIYSPGVKKYDKPFGPGF